MCAHVSYAYAHMLPLTCSTHPLTRIHACTAHRHAVVERKSNDEEGDGAVDYELP